MEKHHLFEIKAKVSVTVVFDVVEGLEIGAFTCLPVGSPTALPAGNLDRGRYGNFPLVFVVRFLLSLHTPNVAFQQE